MKYIKEYMLPRPNVFDRDDKNESLSIELPMGSVLVDIKMVEHTEMDSDLKYQALTMWVIQDDTERLAPVKLHFLPNHGNLGFMEDWQYWRTVHIDSEPFHIFVSTFDSNKISWR
jgi:hypothetical protein